MTIRLSPLKLQLGLRLLRQNPLFAGRAAARLGNRIYHRRGYRSDFNEQGVDVFDRDWDNFVLLDACRYEMLEQHPFDGEYVPATSRGSDTYEFLRANCAGTDLRDRVHFGVTGAGMAQRHERTFDRRCDTVSETGPADPISSDQREREPLRERMADLGYIT